MTESLGLGLGFGMIFAIMMALNVVGIAFWVVALIECVRFPEPVFRAAGTEKTTWLLVVALAGWIGGLVYWFAVRSRLQDADRSGAAAAVPYAGYEVPPVPPGWYRDPHADGLLRWWDGWRWTDHTAPG